MIYLYKDGEDTFYVSREQKDYSIAAIPEEEIQYMDMALDIISSTGIITAYTLFDKTYLNS